MILWLRDNHKRRGLMEEAHEAKVESNAKGEEGTDSQDQDPCRLIHRFAHPEKHTSTAVDTKDCCFLCWVVGGGGGEGRCSDGFHYFI
jgi:hypothetical protein